MFPKAQHRPALTTEGCGGGPVPLAITGDFSIPVCCVGTRHFLATRTAMPETAVSEDHQPLRTKSKIRRSGQVFRVYLPTTKAAPNEQRPDSPFCRTVATGPDLGHYPRTDCRGNGVHPSDLFAGVGDWHATANLVVSLRRKPLETPGLGHERAPQPL